MWKLTTMRFILIAAILTTNLVCIQAQKKFPSQREKDEIANYVVDRDTYDQVLDIVFPRDVLVNAWGYALVLRYKPSFDAESQITVLNRAGKIEIIEYTSVKGSIYLQLKKILRQVGDFNARKAARQIQIRKRVINAPTATAQQLRQSFYALLDQLARHEKEVITEDMKSINLMEDGTQYLLWYRGQASTQFSVVGSDLDTSSLSSESPIVDWMKNVHRIIKQLPAASGNNP
jgi:hypothetical protein